MELKDVAAMHIPSQPAAPAAAGFGDEYGEPARRYAARSWDADVRRQSLELTGSSAARS